LALGAGHSAAWPCAGFGDREREAGQICGVISRGVPRTKGTATKTNSDIRGNAAKGSLTGVAQAVVSTVLVLVTIPLFRNTLGSEAYGVFSLLALVGSVNTFANLGLNASLVRFLAEQGKTRESDHDIAVTLIILAAIVAPVTVVALIFRAWILAGLLGVPPSLLENAEWLYYAMLMCNVFVILGQTFTAILDAQQKVYLTNSYQMVYSIVYWGSILGVILMGWSLKEIAVVLVVSTAIWFVLVAFSGIRSWGWLDLTGLSKDGIAAAKKQLSYGTQLYAAGLIGFLYEPLSKLLISHFFGIREVGIFDMGLRAKNLINGLVLKVLSPLYPMLSQVMDARRIRMLIHDMEQKLFLLLLPALGIIVVTSYPLMAVFFSADVAEIAVTVEWIVGASLFALMVIPMYVFLMAKGYASKTIIIQTLNVLVNIAVFLICVQWLGYFAIVIANAVAIVSGFLLVIYYQRRYLDSVIFDSLNQLLAVLGTFAITTAIAVVLAHVWDAGSLVLVWAPVVIVSLTIVLYRLFGLITPADVARYLGAGTVPARVSVRLLCKRAEPV
jgi:O-antigen/teichoic acid export membrane protein